MRNKWVPYRAGLLNYWYYDEAEFYFAGGRLLLRGSNGSGKSVTMQSLVTVLLDGETRASRLDSFGTQSRRIEDYLLGESEVTDDPERTGYLYLEYKREHTDQYITTGIGLRARRGAGRVEFWGFVVTNGERIGRDIELYEHKRDPETSALSKSPLSQTQLKNKLAGKGQVITERRAYRELVNRHIFGFREIGQFEELMDLLIQLRSPKLSRDFRPSVIYDILNDSLPALSDEDLRPLSSTMEKLDNTHMRMEQLKAEQKELQALDRVYTKYNEAVLGQRLLVQDKHEEMLRRIQREIAETLRSEETARREIREAEEKKARLDLEKETLEEEKSVLEQHEAWKAVAEKEEREAELAQEKERLLKREAEWQEKRRKELATEALVKERAKDASEAEERAERSLEELAALAGDAKFAAHAVQTEDLTLAQLEDARVQHWKREASLWQVHLDDVLAAFQRVRQLQERFAEWQQEVGEEQRQLDAQKAQKARLQGELDAARGALVEDFYIWKKIYEEHLHIRRETELVAILQGLYHDGTWQEAQAILGESMGLHKERIYADIGDVESKMRALQAERAEAEAALHRLKESKEAEPYVSPEVEASRRLLCEQHVDFVPFYEATEFLDDVTDAMRERIESALLHAGVLNALILPDNRASDALSADVVDTILRPKDPILLGESLLSYLRPAKLGDHAVGEKRIVDILGSIGIAQGAFPETAEDRVVIDVSMGSWAMAHAAGHAPREETARYIGKRAREAMRKREIAACEERIADALHRQEAFEVRLEGLKAKLGQTEEAYREFPKETICAEKMSAIRAVEIAVKMQETRLEEKNAKQTEAHGALLREKDSLRRLREGDAVEGVQTAYESARDAMRAYQEEFGALLLTQKNFLAAASETNLLRQQLEEIRADADWLRGEVLRLEGRTEKLTARIDALKKVLEELGAEEIHARIAEIVGRLALLPGEVEEEVRKSSRAHASLQRYTEDMARARMREAQRLILRNAAEEIVKSETAHGFFPALDVDKKAREELKDRRRRDNAPALMKLWNEVGKAYRDGQGTLAEYRIELREEEVALDETANDPADDIIGAEFQAAWQELRELAVRSLVIVRHEGKKSPGEELERLERRIEEQHLLLSEQDQEIYKEVMMNSIGRTISDYIHAARAWVEKMNDLMQSRHTSSGLKFHLAWKTIQNEKDEMDTGELVKLLGRDAALLTDADRQKIGKYFRVRLKLARDMASADEVRADGWIEAVRTTLDYRRWHQFALFYDKGEGIQRRALTDRAFHQLSGGEKAMAMYTPLFSAAYSRYQEASGDAPYLITLDEAFAGVDEQNMREMFSLVESLGFNYIMNSQAIWGTYDVVPALHIYELLRPQGAPCVSAVAFHWDGHVCALVTDEGKNDGA